jgi:hypothetical protein
LDVYSRQEYFESHLSGNFVEMRRYWSLAENILLYRDMFGIHNIETKYISNLSYAFKNMDAMTKIEIIKLIIIVMTFCAIMLYHFHMQGML